MSAAAAVLRALYAALRREQKSRMAWSGNNLYYAAVASIFLMDPAIAAFAAGIVLMVAFFPLSADPLRLVPRSRLQLWPLSGIERRLLRLASPFLNPVTWAVLGFALWRRISIGVAALACGLFLVAFVSPARHKFRDGGILQHVPRIPGRLGELVRKNLRGLLSTLDFYCALIPALAAACYRIAHLLPPDAFLPVTCIILLAISTPSQALFGLDRRGGRTRYRLMPLAGWRILLAKDIAFVLIAVVLTGALSPVAGLAGSLAALALGRKPALEDARAQLRWRLQSGAAFGPAIVQIIFMLAAASFAHAKGPIALIPCLAAWAGSLWWGGRRLDSGSAIAELPEGGPGS